MTEKKKNNLLKGPLTDEQKAARAYKRKRWILIGIIAVLAIVVIVEIVAIIVELI